MALITDKSMRVNRKTQGETEEMGPVSGEELSSLITSHRWAPGENEQQKTKKKMCSAETQVLESSTTSTTRSWKRRLFCLLTEPESSKGSASFYFVLIAAIFASNIVMILQTMETWQFTPTDCHFCGGQITYMFEDDAFVEGSEDVPCVCPPAPLPFTNDLLDCLFYFLTVEWCLRVLLFVPAEPERTLLGRWCQWLSYLTETVTLIDALGIFPYYLESLPNSLVSLRLIRLFRIFQLVRLGQYNAMFLSLTNVLQKSVQYLKLLILILAFGATFFGSMLYWLERGSWKYHEDSGDYRFLRLGVDGVTEEPTPFTSIPTALWWFMVTATTVGYGDLYPTSTAGKWCATFAMLMGVLVIAFPVSVFSDLWSNELKLVQGFESLKEDDNNDDSRRTVDQVNDSPVARHIASQYQATNSSSSDMVLMDKQDLREMVGCLYNIQENERRLKAILRKYQVEERF